MFDVYRFSNMILANEHRSLGPFFYIKSHLDPCIALCKIDFLFFIWHYCTEYGWLILLLDNRLHAGIESMTSPTDLIMKWL